MPIRDVIKNREYQREWARRKRAGLPTKGIRVRKNSLDHLTEEEKKKHRQKQKSEANRKVRVKKQSMIDKAFGVKCFFCDKERGKGKLFTHRKDNTAHDELPKMSIKRLKEEINTNSNQYVLLCYHCHKSVHWCMKILKMNWGDIIKKFNGASSLVE